jgi:NAD(P)-dependent dehydrogenase (short-subunit alcohol dehydrogenase family)
MHMTNQMPAWPRGPVLVTGASSGIGLATVRELRRTGFQVFGTLRRREDAQRLEDEGVVPLLMDLARPESITEGVAKLRASLPNSSLAGLVNNAGIAITGPWEHLGLQEIREVFEINVLGAIAVTQALLPLLRAGRGRIVMISSVSGRLAAPFVGPYTASKYAVEAVCDSLRRELAGHGVTVTLVEPGPVATSLWSKIEGQMERFKDTAYGPALRRFGEVSAVSMRHAIPPERVAVVVREALTRRRPPLRVGVGPGTGLLLRLQLLLPDRLIDRILKGQLSSGPPCA